MKTILRITLFTLLILFSTSFYSKYYRKCVLDPDQKQLIGSMEIQRIPKYRMNASYELASQYHRKPLEFQPLDMTFIYNDFLGAGGSGEVYLIDLQKWTIENGKKKLKTQKKVCKRFFYEDTRDFQQQNYLMEKLDYQVKWFKQLDPLPCEECDPQRQPTLALYPYLNAVSMSDVDVTDVNMPMVLYKISRQLQKAHKVGIIHSDIKMGNILVIKEDNSYRAKIIDWNLATFYYPGYYMPVRKGTVGYYSPQLIFRTAYQTPATDVFSLGITFYRFMAQYNSPYPIRPASKNKNNFQGMASLIGADSMIDLFIKYRYSIDKESRKGLQNIFAKPQKFSGKTMKEILRNQHTPDTDLEFTEQFIDLIAGMLNPDPQQRLTIEQVLDHPYFHQVRRLPPMYEMKNGGKVVVPPPPVPPLEPKIQKKAEKLHQKQPKKQEKPAPLPLLSLPHKQQKPLQKKQKVQLKIQKLPQKGEEKKHELKKEQEKVQEKIQEKVKESQKIKRGLDQKPEEPKKQQKKIQKLNKDQLKHQTVKQQEKVQVPQQKVQPIKQQAPINANPQNNKNSESVNHEELPKVQKADAN